MVEVETFVNLPELLKYLVEELMYKDGMRKIVVMVGQAKCEQIL